MGSLSLSRGVSRPVTSTPIVVQAPAPVQYQPSAPASVDTTINTAPSDAEVNQARVSAILQQKRGLAGTIATSWRGLMQDSDKAQTTLARKTLLGE